MAARPLARGAQLIVGLLVIALGFVLAAVSVLHFATPPGKSVLDPFVGLTGGLALVFLGAILIVPERQGRTRAWLGASMITCIALMFDWVAFGPGERHAEAVVTNGHAKTGAQLREMSRQVLMVSGAVLFNLLALYAWFRARRSAWKRRA